MKKILINDVSFITGNNRVPVISKIKYWQTKGWEISMLCTEDAKKSYEASLKNISYLTIKALNPSNRIVLIFEFLKRNLKALKHLGKLRRMDFEVFYSLSAVLDLLVIPYLLKLSGKKFKWGVVFDNTVSYKDPGNRFIKILAYIFFEISLLLLRKANKIFVVTDDLKTFMLKRNFKETRLVITGNAVEVDLIKSSKPRGDYKYDALFIGRINETKGIYDLLNVVRIVKKEYPKFLLAMMGRGDSASEKAFSNKVEELGLKDNLVMLGFKSGVEKFEIISSSKMYIFLSPKESFGVSLLEAVCSGLPCIAYDLDVYMSLYKNNEVIFVKNGDVGTVSRKVAELLDKGDFTNKAGEALIKRFSWEQIAAIEERHLK